MVPEVFHPLSDHNPSRGGFKFKDETRESRLHPPRPHSGIDLNWGNSAKADLGKSYVAMADGEVVFEGYLPDWGHVAVIWHEELKVWSRYAHSKTFLYKVGDKVVGGEMIGTVGNGGKTDGSAAKFSPHLHWDVIQKALPHWGAYTGGFTIKKLMEYYVDPEPYVKEMQTKRAEYEKSLPKLNVDPDWFITEDVRAWAANYLEDVDAFLANPDPRKILALIKRVEENFEARLMVVEKALKKTK